MPVRMDMRMAYHYVALARWRFYSFSLPNVQRHLSMGAAGRVGAGTAITFELETVEMCFSR